MEEAKPSTEVTSPCCEGGDAATCGCGEKRAPRTGLRLLIAGVILLAAVGVGAYSLFAERTERMSGAAPQTPGREIGDDRSAAEAPSREVPSSAAPSCCGGKAPAARQATPCCAGAAPAAASQPSCGGSGDQSMLPPEEPSCGSRQDGCCGR